MAIDQRLVEAYADHADQQVKAGVLTCHRWEAAMAAGVSVEQWMRDELAAAGIEVSDE